MIKDSLKCPCGNSRKGDPEFSKQRIIDIKIFKVTLNYLEPSLSRSSVIKIDFAPKGQGKYFSDSKIRNDENT